MPMIVGISAVAFVFLVLLTILTIYWVLTKWRNFVQGIPVVGGALSDVAKYLQDRNYELLQDIVGVTRAVISWSIDRVLDGFGALNWLFNAVFISQIGALQQGIDGLQFWRNFTVENALISLTASVNALHAWQTGFVNLNINALNFWRTTMTDMVNVVILPALNSLIQRVDFVTGLTIPTIQARLGAAEQTLQQTLPAEIAENKSDTEALRRIIDQTTTAPHTGLLDRVNGVEGAIGQVLPWAAEIGISIPIAQTLARVGRNPCTCLEEQGQTDMLPMLIYLFQEAG